MDVHLSPQFNLFHGANGSGKTSLLEAIYLLGFGRSFRNSGTSRYLIQEGNDSLTVFARGQDGQQRAPLQVGITRSRKSAPLIKINGDALDKVSALVRHFPVLLHTPQSSEVLTGSPRLRRRMLDWGLFHVEHESFSVLSQYSRLLSQRNALLKQASSGKMEAVFWDSKLAEIGEAYHELRSAYVADLSAHARRFVEKLLPQLEIEVKYSRGWQEGNSLLESLNTGIARDRRMGFTHSGPHRADLRIIANGMPAQDSLSRGQLRLLTAALQLSQAELLLNKAGRNVIFLLDDIGAELDAEGQQRILGQLKPMMAQVVATNIAPLGAEILQSYSNKKMFHVEHGRVSEEIA